MSNLHCETITFPSSDGSHTSSAVLYICPDTPVRAVIQLSHGMCEYVRRYQPMAEFYAAHGIALAGNDHRVTVTPPKRASTATMASRRAGSIC